MATIYPPLEPQPGDEPREELREDLPPVEEKAAELPPVVEPAETQTIPPPPHSESRFNRFMRGLLRVLLVIVLLFGAGMLTTYFTLYRPLQQQAAQDRAALEQAQRDRSSAESQLGELEGRVKSMQTQVEQAQVDVENARNRAALQTVRTDLANARLALANKDGAAARTALVQAQNDLAQLLPALNKVDEALGKSVSGRLEVVLNELNRDPTTAISDMDILARNLEQVEEKLGLK